MLVYSHFLRLLIFAGVLAMVFKQAFGDLEQLFSGWDSLPDSQKRQSNESIVSAHVHLC